MVLCAIKFWLNSTAFLNNICLHHKKVSDIVVTALDSNNAEVAAKTINEVQVQAGYISLYSGYFFSDGVSFPLSYTDDWSGTNNYGF